MTYASSVTVGQAVCKAIGLDQKGVRSLSLIFEPDSVVVARVELLPSIEQANELVNALQKLGICVDQADVAKARTCEFKLVRAA